MQRLSLLAAGNNKNRNSVKQRAPEETKPQEAKPRHDEDGGGGGGDAGDKGDDGGGALADLGEGGEARDAADERVETPVGSASVAEEQPDAEVGEDPKEEREEEKGPSNNGPVVVAPVEEADQVEGLTQRVCPPDRPCP